jgi:hypothetical protein
VSRARPPRPLRITLSGPRRQRIGRRSRVHLFASCDDSCRVTATASVSIRGASKTYRTGNVKRELVAGKKQKLRLKFSKRSLNAVRRALARRKRLTARARVVARSQGGASSSTATRAIRLRL